MFISMLEGEEKNFWVVNVLHGHACVQCLHRSPQVALSRQHATQVFCWRACILKALHNHPPNSSGAPREDPNTSHLELKRVDYTWKVDYMFQEGVPYALRRAFQVGRSLRPGCGLVETLLTR